MRNLLIILVLLAGSLHSEVPDLTGTYDVATLTPLFRPKAYGDNLYLSREEGERIAKEEAKRMAEANESSDPTREAPPREETGLREQPEMWVATTLFGSIAERMRLL